MYMHIYKSMNTQVLKTDTQSMLTNTHAHMRAQRLGISRHFQSAGKRQLRVLCLKSQLETDFTIFNYCTADF